MNGDTPQEGQPAASGLDLLRGYRARIAVREAWKHNFGKYPMDDPELGFEKRREDQDTAYIQQLAEEVRRLRAVLALADKFVGSCGIDDEAGGFDEEDMFVHLTYDEDLLEELRAAIEAAQSGKGE